MANVAVQFNLTAEVPGPLDAKYLGPTTMAPTGTSLYVGLLRYDTTANKLVVCSAKNGENGATADAWVDAGTVVGDTSGSSGVGNYVPIAGGTMTGDLKAPNLIVSGNGDTKVLSAYNDNECVAKFAVNKAISDLVGNATPEVLDTLKEIADELQTPDSSGTVSVLNGIATNTTALNLVKSAPGAQLALDTFLATYKDENGATQDHSTSDYVQNPMGRVAAGGDFPSGQDVTIANLRAKYGTLDHLISAMLKVAAVPATDPQSSGASLALSGQGTTTINLGTAYTRTFTVTMDRGDWSPYASTDASGSPTSSAIYPYGALSAASLTFDGTTYSTAGSTMTTISAVQQEMTTSVTVTFTPQSMSSMSTSNITATTLAGSTVYNNKGVQVAASPLAEKSDWSATDATYTIQAPVYVGVGATNTTANTKPARQATSGSATQNMTTSTGTAYVFDHLYTDFVRFPRQPTAMYAWNEQAQTWKSTAEPSSAYTITSGNQVVGGATVTYYTWEWTGDAAYTPVPIPHQRGNADLKFTF